MKTNNKLHLNKFGIVLLIGCVLVAQDPIFSQQQIEKEKLFEMSLEEIMDVEILMTTAGKTAEKVGEIPASVVIITRKDIETYGYRTLEEILENIPGLYPTDDYSWDGVNFGVRGYWSGVVNRNMIILVNNVNQVTDLSSNYPLHKIGVPVEAIDRIEVVRGPMSVIYGTGAFYGVINIITNKSTENLVSGSYGTANTGKFFLRTSGQEGDFHYAFNASVYNTKGITNKLKDLITNPEYTNDSLVIPAYVDPQLVHLPHPILVPKESNTEGKLENNQKYFGFSGKFKSFYINADYIESLKEFYLTYPSYSKGSLLKSFNTNLTFGFRKDFQYHLTLDSRINYSRGQYGLIYDWFFKNYDGHQEVGSSALDIELDVFYKPSQIFNATFGLNLRNAWDLYLTMNYPSFGYPFLEHQKASLASDDEIVTRAIFYQLNYNPFPCLKFVVGTRLEQQLKYTMYVQKSDFALPAFIINSFEYNHDQIEVIPRFAAICNFNQENIIKLLYGKAINRFSWQQNVDILFDPTQESLKPENIQTLELNYISYLSQKFTASISYFRNSLNNLLTRKHGFIDTIYYSYYSNAGKMFTNGCEVTFQTIPFKNFQFEISGTYQKTEDERLQDVEVAYSPNLLVYFKVSYYPIKDLSLALSGHFVDEMLPYWDESPIDQTDPNSLPIGRIGEVVKGYSNLDGNIRINNLYKGIYINLRVSNILNTEIRYPTFTNNSWVNRGTLGMGRTILLSMGCKY